MPTATIGAPHMCVLTATIGRDPELTYSGTHTCLLTAAIGGPWVQPSIDFFCSTHVCVFVCACSSNWFGKVIERSKPSVDFCIGLYCYTQVCAHSSHWSASPRPGSETSLLAEEFKGSTHMCVLTAAIGLPTLDAWLQPQQH